jgi:mono/diheme cytochrome c family protein
MPNPIDRHPIPAAIARTLLWLGMACAILLPAAFLSSAAEEGPSKEPFEVLIDSLNNLERESDSARATRAWLKEEIERSRESLSSVGDEIQQAQSHLEELQANRLHLEDRLKALDTAAGLLDRLDGKSASSVNAGHRGRLFNTEIRPILSDNCFACHGPDEKQRKAGLRLDTQEGATAELRSGNRAIVPGDPEKSELVKRITTEDSLDRMPPKDSHKTLTPEQVTALVDWISEGGGYAKHWSLIPPEKAALPSVSNSAWSANPIDRFILARLEREGIAPSPRADKATLLRRVHLDLTGIPPSPEDLEEFLGDDSPDALGKAVDRLLASPHYGERWGRHWLDGARYADSNGYSIDGPREMWLYRDWVVDALNRDLPFDRFVVQQLAGDLLPDATLSQKVATGFHRNTMINQEGGIDKEEFRIESIVDRVNTTGTVFLGLTVECAQCHDHKYDPISQEEYYRLFAIFNNDEEPSLEVPTPEQAARKREVEQAVAAAREELADYLVAAETDLQPEWEKELSPIDQGHLAPRAKAAYETPASERSEDQRKVLRDLFAQRDDRAGELRSKIEEVRKTAPDIPTTLVLEQRKEPRETRIHLGGDFTRKGEPVAPGVPASLNGDIRMETPTRLEFAQWLVHPDHPLLSRVTVNRVWQRYFGRGLVETENDFGTQGSPPTHPDLLDWLAVDLIEKGWSLKALHRLILTSETYCQSSQARPDLEQTDPRNLLLARQERLRLDAEIIRDSGLAVAGVLNEEIGGPPVHPPIPEGVMSLGQVKRDWNADTDEDRYRRGLYTYFWRMTPYPSLTVFDAPNATVACTRRVRSNTPLQSLTLLNDEAYFEMAEFLTDRLLAVSGNPSERLDRAFELCLMREPSPREREVLTSLLDSPVEGQSGEKEVEKQRWLRVARVLLNLDEFITRE